MLIDTGGRFEVFWQKRVDIFFMDDETYESQHFGSVALLPTQLLLQTSFGPSQVTVRLCHLGPSVAMEEPCSLNLIVYLCGTFLLPWRFL